MKKNIINSLLLATILFVGCKKDNTRYPFSIDLVRVPYVNTLLDATGSAAIDLTNLASFNGKYSITLLYPNDIKPNKVDVVVRKNNDNTVIKVLQAGVTTFPSSFTVTAAQLATAFGAAIKLNDNYDIGTDIYVGDKKYEAFPAAGGIAYGGTGQQNQPGFSPTIRFSAICAYDPNIYQGNFVVTRDDWADFSVGDIVVLTKVDATHFSWVDPFARNPVPIVVTVNPLSNVISIPKQTIGTSWTYSANPATYPNPFVQTGAGTNVVAPCDKTVTMAMQYGFSASIFTGTYPLVFTKQ